MLAREARCADTTPPVGTQKLIFTMFSSDNDVFSSKKVDFSWEKCVNRLGGTTGTAEREVCIAEMLASEAFSVFASKHLWSQN